MNERNSYKDENSKYNMVGKRGQVALFVIVGIVIVSGILVFFLYLQPTFFSDRNANLGFENCVQDVLEEQIEILAFNGGIGEQQFVYTFNGENVSYLCYSNEYYKSCVNQNPLLKQNFEDELEAISREQINSCYRTSVNSLKAQGFDVVSGTVEYDVLLNPGEVEVEINAPTSVTGDTTQSLSKFEISFQSSIYNMLMIATSIVQLETGFGDAEVSSLMFYYPDVLINKHKQSDGTTIYVLTDKVESTKFQFASRSYAWPPGYGVS